MTISWVQAAACTLSFSPNARRSQEMNEAQRKEHERRFGQEIDAVEVFNQLNSATVHGVPEDGGIDTLQRHLPLLKKMQCLLSQRPRRGGDEGFTMPNYIRGKPSALHVR